MMTAAFESEAATTAVYPEGLLSAPSEPLVLPTTFANYILLAELGRGGMGLVFRARPQHAFGPEQVALKVLRPDLPHLAPLFQREAQTSLLLKHPHVVRALAMGTFEERPYFVMECIAGVDLNQLLQRCVELRRPIPIPLVAYIARAVARGLHYAHTLRDRTGRNLRIINRDVSPSNVRLAFDGEVKVLDFGIAQTQLQFTSEIGVLKGKYSYMSPEQVCGWPVDERTDIFAVGIMLHEMLTGKRLFAGQTDFATMELVRAAEVIRPSFRNQDVDPGLDAVCLKALARNAEDRYQSAGQLAEGLAPWCPIAGGLQLRDYLRTLFCSEYLESLREGAVRG